MKMWMLCLILSSCSSSIVITSYPCRRDMTLGPMPPTEGIDFLIQSKIVNALSLSTAFPLCGFLGAELKRSQKLKYLQITSFFTSGDVLWGLIPGISRRTVEIQGAYDDQVTQ